MTDFEVTRVSYVSHKVITRTKSGCIWLLSVMTYTTINAEGLAWTNVLSENKDEIIKMIREAGFTVEEK